MLETIKTQNKKTKIVLAGMFFVTFCILAFGCQKAVSFYLQREEEAPVHVPEVKGAQDNSTTDEVELKKQEAMLLKSFPVVDFQPVRKEGVADLNISNAHASLILDVDSGTILHYQNGKEIRQIASLTKMMTALLVVENVKDLDELVVVDEEVLCVYGTRVGCPNSDYCVGTRLQKGEKISVRSLLKAMLLNSANDAATALGKHVGGTIDEFVDLMNKRATELGLNDSNFCTPSGLEINGMEESCFSTAYDIARIATQTMKHEIIWDILKIQEEVVYSSDGKYSHELRNTDRLLGELPGCLGGKTGFTPRAGQSLLTAVESPDGKHKIMIVVLDDPNRWNDIRVMSDWAFTSYQWK